MGILGLLVGAGVTQLVRVAGTQGVRREAMGFGDVTLMGMIGAFLGWQAAILTFFAGAFFGLAHALWKLSVYLKKWARGAEIIDRRSRTPFWTLPEHGSGRPGPVLALDLAWLLPTLFRTLGWLFWRMLGVNVPIPELRPWDRPCRRS